MKVDILYVCECHRKDEGTKQQINDRTSKVTREEEDVGEERNQIEAVDVHSAYFTVTEVLVLVAEVEHVPHHLAQLDRDDLSKTTQRQ
mgnify:CR=1 FL=1